MLDDFGHEMDNTQSRLDNVMKKLAKVSHMTSGNDFKYAMALSGFIGLVAKITQNDK